MVQPTATYRRTRGVLIASLILCGLAAWAVRHIYHLTQPGHITNASLAIVWFASFLMLGFSSFVAMLERPKRVTKRQQLALDRLHVTALVPAYNEDPEMLRECLRSMLLQSRRPNHIYVVDDGSDKADYTTIKNWARRAIAPHIKLSWARTENCGKRHAQARGIMRTPDADIYLTVDSDTILEKEALAEVLKPLADHEVQSVAGVLVALNNDQNLLTRFTGVWELMWQLIDRSTQSVLNCVTVNSGPLAVYRAETIRQYLDSYLNEDFFGQPVGFSDDSLLTTYALLSGKTVQQPTAIAFSATPDNVNHHVRRYMRWMRGSFIRSWWRFRYLRINSFVYWWHFAKWMQMVLSTIIFIYIVVLGTLANPDSLPYFLLVPLLVTYAQALRYLVIVRSDQTTSNQLANYMLAPLAGLWQMTVLRVVKYYAYATCRRTGWGTRSEVELALSPTHDKI